MLKYVLCLCVLLVGVTCEANEFASPKLTECEQHMVDQINAYRVRCGLQPVQVDVMVMADTRRHASWMATNRVMRHADRLTCVENIAMSQKTVSECINTWINSGGHRANLLGHGTRLGVAAYQTPFGRIYWCYRLSR